MNMTREFSVRYVDHEGTVYRTTQPAMSRSQARQVVQGQEDCASVLEVVLPGKRDRNEIGRTLFDWDEEEDID